MPRKWKPGEKKRMRRAWAKPYAVKSGQAVSKTILSWYKNAANSLGEAEALTRFPNVTPGRKDIKDRSEEILQQFDDPMFITVLDNSLQRCRIFFNSRKDCFIIQHVNWRTREVRLSITYANMDRAKSVWVQSKVCWKHVKSLPTSK